MIKNGKEQNVIPTTTAQNLAAAKENDTYAEAIGLFRALEWANDRGTGEHQFDNLEEYFIEKQGLMSYLEDGLTVAQASLKKAQIAP